jgi:eukaryotic-like serine/threonine-protein kinase
MNATAEELPGADINNMDETVVHQPKNQSGPGPEDPTGRSDMPKANHSLQQAQGRYTFGSGARPLDGYTIKRAIGRGGFGEVYYATSDSGKEVALKLILRNLDVERRGVIQCMNLKCPNLLSIFDMKTNDADDTFVVMEYVAGPSLASVLKQYPKGLPLPEVRHWLKGLVEGVAYLHDHGVVHRDLKPANLFMEEGIVKIGDYGLAKLITPSQGSEHSESIGTCHYMAPEIGSGKYNKAIDIYAMGVILYELLTGRVPFEGETVNEVLMKHLTARPDVSMLPQPYQAIVAKALAKDPNHRPSRVYDLLPPEDAPAAPEVRIIGDGKKVGGNPGAGRPEREDVLRIEAEEPIFYIGPETRPPRRRGQAGNLIAKRLRANWEALRSPGRYQSPGQPIRTAVTPGNPPANGAGANANANAAARRAPSPPRPIPGHAAPRAIAAVLAPPPPTPPPLPSSRVRLAELTNSMLWAAPLLAVLTIPTMALLSIDPSNHPQQLAYLYGMALLGTWTALIPSKVVETRKLDGTSRRLIFLAAGLVLGIVGILLTHNLRLDLDPQHEFFDEPRNFQMVYFGALYAIMGGWSYVAARDRAARFQLRPILWTAMLSGALVPFWPYARPDGIAIAVLIAMGVQLVSPWNEAASLYTRYVRVSAKRKGNVA